MSTNRLALVRAQRQNPSQANPTELSMLKSANEKIGSVEAVSTTQQFFTEITSLQASVSQVNNNVSEIAELRSRSLNSITNDQDDHQANEVVEETRALCNRIRRWMESISSETRELGMKGRITQQDGEMRMRRLAHVRDKFVEALQEYQRTEQEHRFKVRERAERQFRMVKPDATAEEVKQVVDNDQGGQIIMQALVSDSGRYAESRNAYSEVQSRQEEIKKLEKSMAELAMLMNDMATLTEQQDFSFVSMEKTVLDVEADTRQGLAYTEQAVVSARSARKKRWICFSICIVIILVIAIGLAVKFAPSRRKE
ncbi:hypothetical protein VNI00_012222 [Paramarasmius palmivorus]|uniref:t-SNARE coiled-coil homology domain-containing protein n=1 Tax=Paramarasmius palmivorus TaxID=297713 RepID=A0AAW0C8N8_9AGAR